MMKAVVAALIFPTLVAASAESAPATTRVFASSPKLLTNVIYVSDTVKDVITAYENDPGKGYPMLGQMAMPSRPEGIATDAASNLYVTLRNQVYIYPPATYVGYYGKITITFPKTPTLVLTDQNYPTDVAVGPDGEIYVADLGGPKSPAGGDIGVYLPGSGTAAYTIPFGAASFVDAVTLDAANNLYITWREPSGTAYVNVSPPPAAGGTRTIGSTVTAATSSEFRGIQYDDKDSAIVYADYSTPEIVAFPAIKRFGPFDRLGTPDYISFDKAKDHIYVPDHLHDLIEVYSFPQGNIRYIINGLPGGAPAGCALLPAPPY
jgi:sugar lactone lactonase YvrE